MSTHRYRVEHVTRYVHVERAATSHHVAYLEPRTLPRQQVIAHRLEVLPHAADRSARIDYFGNAVQHFSVFSPYRELLVAGHSVVDVQDRTGEIDPLASPAWERARDALAAGAFAAAGRVVEFRYASPYVDLAPELEAFARESFHPGRAVLDASMDLMHRIHRSFTFDPGATSITTPVARVLALRQGVCQDFAHVQIACIRSLGLAARYVSGYLLTNPPPGQPRLQGADASHAWLSVYCPTNGWVDLDPTNDLLPHDRHVTLAWGRDYGDVSPLRGVVLGGGEHVLEVGVSVTPVEGQEDQERSP